MKQPLTILFVVSCSIVICIEKPPALPGGQQKFYGLRIVWSLSVNPIQSNQLAPHGWNSELGLVIVKWKVAMILLLILVVLTCIIKLQLTEIFTGKKDQIEQVYDNFLPLPFRTAGNFFGVHRFCRRWITRYHYGVCARNLILFMLELLPIANYTQSHHVSQFVGTNQMCTLPP